MTLPQARSTLSSEDSPHQPVPGTAVPRMWQESEQDWKKKEAKSTVRLSWVSGSTARGEAKCVTLASSFLPKPSQSKQMRRASCFPQIPPRACLHGHLRGAGRRREP